MSLKPPNTTNTLIDQKHVFDEGSALPDRSGINFVGAGVAATDDAANNRINVTIPATGSVFQSVDALSGNPRAVADWGPLINTAISNGVRHFIFGPFDYPFTTQINVSARLNVFFEGAGGSNWLAPTSTDFYTRLLWGGTGGTAAINATGANPQAGTIGFVMRDLDVMYTSASFTGTLVDSNNGTLHIFERVGFASTQSTVSAAAAVSVRNVNTALFDGCVFQNFISHISGVTSSLDFSNVIHFRDCTFQGICTQYALNPNHDWRFSHCTFEMVPGSGAGNMQFGITTNTNTIAGGTEVVIDDCDWWDGSGGTIKGVYFPSTLNNSVSLAVINTRDHNSENAFARSYDHQASGSLIVLGGNTNSKIDVGDAAVKQKSDITILGLDTSSTGDKAKILNLNTGHANVNVGVNKGGPNLVGTSGQVTTLSHERTLRVDQPTIAAHSGVTNHAFNIFGTDMAGWLTIQNNSGGTGPTGLLADITLAVSPTSFNVQGSTNGNTSYQLPLVQIWPFQPDDSGNAYASPNPATTWTCQPYAYAKSARVAGNQLTFSIGVNVGIPNAGLIGIGYRVIHL